MTIGIVGVGLIGGSFALAVKELGHSVLGFDASAKHLDRAVELGLVQGVESLNLLAQRCDLIAVCVPVHVVVDVCEQLLATGSPATIMELSSTKGVLAKALKDNPNRKRLVLTHPMAGTEFSGPDAAIAGLFKGKTTVLCDLADSDPAGVELVKKVYEDIGMRCVEQASEPHDLHVAYVSHISHISSFALSLTVLEKEKDEAQIFNLASGGFASTVRLAKSNPDTWSPIFAHNRDHVLDVLDEYINVLASFRTALIKQNFDEVHALMSRANAIGPMLP
ncbi:MAG: prephenate dehydrogenase [Saprospiraceae bacterium]